MKTELKFKIQIFFFNNLQPNNDSVPASTKPKQENRPKFAKFPVKCLIFYRKSKLRGPKMILLRSNQSRSFETGLRFWFRLQLCLFTSGMILKQELQSPILMTNLTNTKLNILSFYFCSLKWDEINNEKELNKTLQCLHLKLLNW